ncbi:MAG: Mg-protoporphyrin methyl transferase [Marmoricola sp.]|jgi:SAM-dependent methyltransferase|nr:Mg-protoporphyrin methyl transferase [Marmoricola sp.]
MSTAESVDGLAGFEPVATGEPRHGSFSEVFSDALRGIPVSVRGIAPSDQPMPVHEWLCPASPSDQLLLDHCRGATIDLGCGPGRMCAHLALQGHFVLGVDIVPEAVEQTRRRGVPALRRNIFTPLPGEGSWDTVLLADGNIGIGGAPLALLRRARELLDDGGRVVCDLAEPGTGLSLHAARLVSHLRRSGTFPWAKVGPDAIETLAGGADLDVLHVGECDGRWFAVLTT